ncbi:hypothetical protein Trisim1_009100 [Trichoderma cf. simile WF8]|uniref:Uncharacterized protein n=1 Tax=Trichoderma guizhouense TaxID=1491466 RepID=A0A1T3CZE8_9HYPO|nr:hypothetical protein A0O28_0065730 [Trichoderma guizhouense]
MFDPDAFEIILLIVHAQAHKLPKEVSLDMVTHVAILADDLQCADPISPFIRQWALNNNFWSTSVEFGQLMQKIFICTVFQLKERFSSLTQTAITSSLNKIPSYGLPISPQIIKAIEEKRASVMKEQVKYLYTVEKELQDDTLCWECRAQNIGYLKYNLHLSQLPVSETSAQWANVTCRTLRDKLLKFRYATRTVCTYQSNLKHPSFKKKIVSALGIPDEGLDLSSFINTSP